MASIRNCCWQASTETSFTFGICGNGVTCNSSSLEPSSRWHSSCVLRTTRRRPTASWAWCFPSRIFRLPSGFGIARTARTGQTENGGPQIVEISRDGKHVYFINGLYTPWDDQFYPDGVRGWVAKVDDTEKGMKLGSKFFLEVEGMRTHQMRLEGGDASSDSFCYA